MTTQMNFGPEWMRGGEVPKRNTQYTNFNTQPTDKNEDNSFKYPKEHMLNLYEPVNNVATSIQQDYVPNNEGKSSLSYLEKEYLHHTGSDKDLTTFETFAPKSKVNDPFMNGIGYKTSNEDVPLWGGIDKYDVGNFDSFGVYLDNSIGSSLEPEEEKEFYEFGSRDLNPKHYHHQFIIPDDSTTTATTTTTRSYQWIYRDPTGNIQGPFSALEMQGWYEAGFFENSLLVKREDVNYFEPLDALILKVKNSKIPFLSPWPSPSITDAFITTGLKQPLQHQQQQPFGNTSFLPSSLPRLNNRSSPWENNPASSTASASAAAAASWLSNQNDPQYNNRPPSSVIRPLDNLYTDVVDYQQLAMSQQMEQQYLSMLRQNQQHHIQLQQRMVQQQQQQQLLLQQQHVFMNNQNNFEHVISPTVPQIPINSSSSRGWNSTPGTPGIIDIAQNPWTVVNKQDEPFIPSPDRSRSPPSKTQVEEENDPLTFTLSNMTIADPIVVEESQIELPKVTVDTTTTTTKDSTITTPPNATIDINTTTMTTTTTTITTNEPKQKLNKVPGSSSWNSTTTTTSQKKSLREIQSEEISRNKKKTMPSRSNTWSAVSAASKPTRSTRNQQVKTNNAWETPAKQKRISTPNMSYVASSSNTNPTPKSASHTTNITNESSSQKGPSEEFLNWCKLSLRELNAGVNVSDILQMLLSFPVDESCLEIIQDIIYTNSTSMDGRRFANDFLSRRKADLDGKLNFVLPKNNVISSEFKVVTKKGRKKQQQQL